MKKKAELFTIYKLIDILEEEGTEFGYKVDVDIDIDIENTATLKYFNDENNLLLKVIVLYGGLENTINIFDQDNKSIYSETIKATNYNIEKYKNIIDKVFEELGKRATQILNTPEKIYDYGEEHNWQGLEQKHYEILSQDSNLARMAVADMQDKGIIVPDILKNFRRYSMSFKEMVISKIAKNKKIEKQINRVAKVTKKAGWKVLTPKDLTEEVKDEFLKDSIKEYAGHVKGEDFYFVKGIKEKEDDQFSYEWEEGMFGEWNKNVQGEVWYSLTDLGDDWDYIYLIKEDKLYKMPNREKLIDFGVVSNKTVRLKKKASEEDLDVKLKVQKNKPAGLDTTSPKSLPESIRPLMQDLKGKMATLKETEAELADVKAGLDAKYQEAKNKSQIVEKQAEIENLTQNIGKLLFAAKNETFQFQDNLVALTHQTKVVPAKATDKWKFEKVFAKLQELMGDENAQKFLDATLNGLQSQATEKTITELNIFSPTQKQMKKSDTSDTNKFIDTLKEIYTNLRAYFIDVKKANNIIEEQLATGATASKKQVVSKKANAADISERIKRYKQNKDEKALNILNKMNEQDLKKTIKEYRRALFDQKETYTPEQEEIRHYLFDIDNQEMTLKQVKENLESKKDVKVVKKAKMHKKAADNKVRIFLTNLGKYNEGELVGEWVDLPVQDFKPILERIGIDGKNYEEVFITDYEAPFEIGEYENINALNEKVKKIEALDEEQKDILYSLADEWDFDELYEKVVNGDYHYIPQGSITNAIGEKEASNIDLAYGYIDQLGGFEALAPKTIEDYFDYDSYGETLSYDFQTTNKGYVEIY